MTRIDDATRAQMDAADPLSSTWLSANAGSGKTRVLTNRVARLLLRKVPPQSILCLTYTKAAASEMQNRLFARLGEWAMMEDSALVSALTELGTDQALTPELLDDARRLFARAIETPGGLKIQTIHSFCAALLRRFPLEAGVPPSFTEMDDRAAEILRNEVLDHLAQTVPDIFATCAAYVSDVDMGQITAEITKHSEALATPLDWDATAQLFSLPPGYTQATLNGSVFLGSERALFQSIIPIMRASSQSSNTKIADKLAAITRFDHTDLATLEDILLTGTGAKEPFTAKVGSLPTKDCRAAMPDHIDALNALMARVEAAREDRLSLLSTQRTHALYTFAGHFLPEYQRRKALHGLLDFDDLIVQARNLLTQPGVAQWVLYKIDGGIDHVLVDEAQDTSPVQWEVIRLLTQEFAAGETARSDTPRTVFVVGDKKQSIYSFQGADPDRFDEMRQAFAARLQAAKDYLEERELRHSFRSADAILRLVDEVFRGAPAGLGPVNHIPFHTQLPGRVDLWPLVEPETDSTQDDWEQPQDMIGETHHHRRLAKSIATEIIRLKQHEVLWQIKNGEKVARPITEGDVLILVQGRTSGLFHEIIRACKEAELEIAGADRLKIGGELAVKDILAVLAFLATPEDNLSLACALRSPLFGWDESQLYDLAAGRTQPYIWQILRNRKETAANTVSILQALLDAADFLRPYDLIDRLLLRYNGRHNLIARLGPEAQDGIDAVLSQALQYEQSEPPSLTGFLSWMETGEVEIKRQADSAGNRLRVMTVHGAKGLEAPIVILPDTADKPNTVRAELLPDKNGHVLWKTNAETAPLTIKALREAAQEKQLEERQRLLYVAMTRAEQWLIVAAAGTVKEAKDSWYHQIETAMDTAGPIQLERPDGTGKRLQTIDWPTSTQTGKIHDTQAPTPPFAKSDTLPTWTNTALAAPPRPVQTFAPSDLGGAKVLAGTSDDALDVEAAMERGHRLHRLLEHLPPHPRSDWPALAAQIAPLDPDLLPEAEAVLANPVLAPLFADGTLAEVDITAYLPLTERPLYGMIDRLIIAPDHVLAIDYKSNALVPATPNETPEGLLRQMGAYAAALACIYPDKRIDTAILWTRTATLMPLPHALVTSAFQNAPPP